MTLQDAMRLMVLDAMAAAERRRDIENDNRFECIKGDYAHLHTFGRFQDAIDLGILTE